MKRLLVYCEGETEEGFVKEVLAPYLYACNINAQPIGARGVSKYSIIKKELLRLCKSNPTATITTMLDYYGLPAETPAMATATGALYERVTQIETAVENDLGNLRNLLFNLTVHEFEGLLFSNPTAFNIVANEKAVVTLTKIKNDFESPEHINQSYDTAPSRRILKVIPAYMKIRDGTLVAKALGIEVIAEQCPHFSRWLAKIKEHSLG